MKIDKHTPLRFQGRAWHRCLEVRRDNVARQNAASYAEEAQHAAMLEVARKALAEEKALRALGSK
jgi:hypothetical protein